MDEIHGNVSRPAALLAKRVRGAVEMKPIAAADLSEVADFLQANLNDQVPWSRHARRCHGMWQHPITDSCCATDSASSVRCWRSTRNVW